MGINLRDPDVASRIALACMRNMFWLCRVPGTVNIVYVEGINTDGKPNGRPTNEFDDVRTLIAIGSDGVPKLMGIWEATTQPGKYWTQHRMNPGGAFHIALGQYKAWSLGMHHTHEAWVQTGVIDGYRDHDNKMIRDLRYPVSGDQFGVNQHWGYDLPPNDWRNSSAAFLA